MTEQPEEYLGSSVEDAIREAERLEAEIEKIRTGKTAIDLGEAGSVIWVRIQTKGGGEVSITARGTDVFSTSRELELYLGSGACEALKKAVDEANDAPAVAAVNTHAQTSAKPQAQTESRLVDIDGKKHEIFRITGAVWKTSKRTGNKYAAVNGSAYTKYPLPVFVQDYYINNDEDLAKLVGQFALAEFDDNGKYAKRVVGISPEGD